MSIHHGHQPHAAWSHSKVLYNDGNEEATLCEDSDVNLISTIKHSVR